MQKQTNPEPSGAPMAKVILAVAMIISLGALFGAVGYYLTKQKPINAPIISPTPKTISAIKISPDTKSILNVETKAVIFTIEDANNNLKEQLYYDQDFQNKKEKYMGDCFKESILSNNGRFIVFSTGCLLDSSQAWVGVYRRHFTCDFHTTWQCNPNDPTAPGLEGFNQFYIFSHFLIAGSGRNFIWSADDKTIAYEADLGLSGMTETRTINARTGDILERKNMPATNDLNISDWQTYKNEEYGFEFKYPADWFIYSDRIEAQTRIIQVASSLDRKIGEGTTFLGPALDIRIPGENKDKGVPINMFGESARDTDWQSDGMGLAISRQVSILTSPDIVIYLRTSISGESINSEKLTLDQILFTFKFTEK